MQAITIEQALRNQEGFTQALNNLFINKPKKKVLQKACEELSELTTKLLQSLNNKNKIDDEDLLEEIVDVQMHILLLQRYFKLDLCHKMVDRKAAKFLRSRDHKQYCLIKEIV